MDTLTAFDKLASCSYAMTGLAGIIDELAENNVLLTREELDFIGSVTNRIADEIHSAAEILYQDLQQIPRDKSNDEQQ